MAEAGALWQLKCEKVEQRCGYLLTTRLWSDCTFMVGPETKPEEIQAHKLILAMASPAFEQMFYGGSSECNKSIVPIHDVDPEVFRDLLQYIYTGDIKIGSLQKAWDLWNVAQKYMVPHLEKECDIYIWSELEPRNACRLYEYALLYDERTLMDACIQIISSNTKEVLLDSSFEDVNLNTVITVCSLDHLNVDSELEVFRAVVRYANAEQRRSQVSPRSDGEPPSKKLCDRSELATSDEKALQSVDSACQSPAVELDSKPPSEVTTPEPTDTDIFKEVSEEVRLRIRPAIEHIRFLSLSSKEIAAGPARSALLTRDEWLAVLVNIECKDTTARMPRGFSTCRERRQPRNDPVADDCTARPYPKPSLEPRGGAATTSLTPAEIVSGLLSSDRKTLQQAARAARLMTCADVDGTRENCTQLVAAGGVPPLVHALHHARIGVQYDAAWAIGSIACAGERESLKHGGAIPALVDVIGRGGGVVAEQAAWALGNIAWYGHGACLFISNAVLDAGAPSALLPYLQPTTPASALGTYVRTYRYMCQDICVCSWKELQLELVTQLSPALPYIEKLLVVADERVLAESCWVLRLLTGSRHLRPELVPPSLVERVTAVLQASTAPTVQAAALAALGRMMRTAELIDRFLEAGGLDCIINCLKCGNSLPIEHAADAAASILEGTHLQIQQAFDKGILEALVPALTEGDDASVEPVSASSIWQAISACRKPLALDSSSNESWSPFSDIFSPAGKEKDKRRLIFCRCKSNAARAITNLCKQGSPSQLCELARGSALQPYCNLLMLEDCRTVLTGLLELLKRVEQNTQADLIEKLKEFNLPILLVLQREMAREMRCFGDITSELGAYFKDEDGQEDDEDDIELSD